MMVEQEEKSLPNLTTVEALAPTAFARLSALACEMTLLTTAEYSVSRIRDEECLVSSLATS